MPEKLPADDGVGVTATKPSEPLTLAAAPEPVEPPKTFEGVLRAIEFPVERATTLLLEVAKQYPDLEVPAATILQTISSLFGYEHLNALKVVLGQELLQLAKTGKSPVEKYDAELAG